jgi:hypothetical protein
MPTQLSEGVGFGREIRPQGVSIASEFTVVVQAFAAVRPDEGLVRLLVVPGLVGIASFHGRDDVLAASSTVQRDCREGRVRVL